MLLLIRYFSYLVDAQTNSFSINVTEGSITPAGSPIVFTAELVRRGNGLTLPLSLSAPFNPAVEYYEEDFDNNKSPIPLENYLDINNQVNIPLAQQLDFLNIEISNSSPFSVVDFSAVNIIATNRSRETCENTITLVDAATVNDNCQGNSTISFGAATVTAQNSYIVSISGCLFQNVIRFGLIDPISGMFVAPFNDLDIVDVNADGTFTATYSFISDEATVTIAAYDRST
ncbi:MAG: hypothetical protein Q9M91_06525 [Candidatus Dojkabacteria bacterium]|nr:hypothetical protein [Candidatus Dojkabacteria bacterium]MDQ7021451.1 hypothetical protein [Candidatus Dojkabacteria bacterium]